MPKSTKKDSKKMEYRKNYLTSVVVRIDLASSITGIEKGLQKGLTNKILEVFPLMEPKQVQIIQSIFKAGASQIENVPARKVTIWNYHGRDREKTVSIGENYLYIEYKKYEGYQNLKKEFLDTLNDLVKCYPEIQISRFGLRYTNNIELNEANPTDWGNYISNNLLSIFKVADKKDTITRAFQLLSINKDDMNLNFQYGMHNPDFPANIKKKIFILDIDAYCYGAQTENEIKEKIDLFYNHIQKYFESSIKPGLRKLMNNE